MEGMDCSSSSTTRSPDAQHGGFVDWAVSLPDLYAEALSANGTVCEDRPFKEVIQVIMRSYGWTLTQQDWQLYQKNIRWGSTRHTEGWPREDKPRRLPPASWVVSGETNSALPWSWTSSLQSHKEPNSQCWSQPVCGILHKSMGLVSEVGVESCRTASQAHWCSPRLSRPGGVGPAKPLTAGGWKKQSADTPQAEGRSGHARGKFLQEQSTGLCSGTLHKKVHAPVEGTGCPYRQQAGPHGRVCWLRAQKPGLPPSALLTMFLHPWAGTWTVTETKQPCWLLQRAPWVWKQPVESKSPPNQTTLSSPGELRLSLLGSQHTLMMLWCLLG